MGTMPRFELDMFSSIEPQNRIISRLNEQTSNSNLLKPSRPIGKPDYRMQLNENAVRVLVKRYLLKDANGNIIESPEDLFWRVASVIATADLKYNPKAHLQQIAEEFFYLMARLDFLPNSPTLMNAGRELGQLSACFVLPVGDSMEEIFETVKQTALIHKSGGGTGFSFSRLRPSKDIVQSTRGISSGPVSFISVFDAATEAIKQGGTRRGANMAILRIDHSDILEFISIKKDQKKLTNFNISVAVTVDFMEKVEKNEKYPLINPRSGEAVEQLNAREVFDQLTQTAWETGDPGIIFIDRINKDNPTPLLGEIESTNPCGEQPLLPYESCNLGSINLSNMTKEHGIDYEKIRTTVRSAVHLLDNVIDLNKYPLPQIEAITKANRKIGLGVMGFADLLIKLGIPYNSKSALIVAEEVMHFIQTEANVMSMELADQRGEFPNFKNSIYYHENGPKYRNATRTTIAPTGTISIIAGTTSGIEPLFAVAFLRNVLDNDQLIESHPIFQELAIRDGFYSEELMQKVAELGSIKEIATIPQAIRDLFITSHDIEPEWHVKIQSACQKFTDNAVSKTVNFKHDATVEDVRRVYKLAYKLGCKGITIYRDGSRKTQVLEKGLKSLKGEYEEIAESETFTRAVKRNRPKILVGKTIRMQTGCGPLYVTINEDELGTFEIFNTMGKAGGCVASQTEALGRLISLALRSAVTAEEIIKQLIGISCHKPYGFGENRILSCADAIAKAIKIYRGEKQQRSEIEIPPVVPQENIPLPKTKPGEPTILFDEDYIQGLMGAACPECGSTLEFSEGCVICKSCGYSECD